MPELVPFLAAADVPNSSYIAAITQLYPLLPLLKQHEEQIALIELPLQPDDSGEPFTPARYLQGDSVAVKTTDVLQEILLGGLLPHAGQDFSTRQQQFSAYLKRLLQRDIMDLTPVSDDMKFYRFLCAVPPLWAVLLIMLIGQGGRRYLAYGQAVGGLSGGRGPCALFAAA